MKKNVVRKGLILLLGLFLAAATTVCSEEVHQKFRPEQFENPGRDKYQKPAAVVEALGLKAGNIVADIGAGSGYFARRIAEAVEPGGFVYAVDIDPDMLRYIQDQAHKKTQHNIVTVLCTEDDPMLAPASVDLIFICDTIHHITNRGLYYQKLLRSLRPQGRLAIVDYHKRQLPVGPPVRIKIAREDILKEVTSAGFRLVRDYDFLPYQYFLVFTRSS